jgi:hypothetical protein
VSTIWEEYAERAQKRAESQARAERWGIPPRLRGEIIKVALGICGIETDRDGHVKRTSEEPRPKPREKLAAMRVLATYDKISIDEQKLELRGKAGGRDFDRHEVELDRPEIPEEVVTEALLRLIDEPPPPHKPAPPPENQAELEMAACVRDARWPLSVEVRDAVIETAANLCGLAITEQGAVEPIPVTEENPAPKRRTKLGALRVFARFDRLSLEHRRLVFVARQLKRKQGPASAGSGMEPEVAVRFAELIEEGLCRWRERESGGGSAPIVGWPDDRVGLR